MKSSHLIRLFLLFPIFVHAQNYTATNGSSIIGSLNVHNNPASIVNSPMKWDLTLFGLQDKHSTNAIQIFNYSLLSNPAKSEYIIAPGLYKRYANLNFNLNLLNARIALNRRNAIAFGANLKSYLLLNTSSYNFYDTLGKFGNFFKLNEGVTDLSLDMATSSWVELYASYGRTIVDNESMRMNAGVTLKVNKGLSGAFVDLAGGQFVRTGSGSNTSYTVTNAELDFGYSSNYDRWDSTRKFGDNFRDFRSITEGGASFDIGVEWLKKLPSSGGTDDDDYYHDYDWKVGVSILDIGYGQYRYGQYSTLARNVKAEVNDTILDRAFDSTVTNVRSFRDSLSTLFDRVEGRGGVFRVDHPTRLVLNVDKFIGGALYINADLSIAIPLGFSKEKRVVKDLNRLTITGRWETRKKGFYLPIYFNNQDQFWVGGAVRIGPVLFGLHNLANLVSKKKSQRGGGYLAIILKAWNTQGKKSDKRLDCPPGI